MNTDNKTETIDIIEELDAKTRAYRDEADAACDHFTVALCDMVLGNKYSGERLTLREYEDLDSMTLEDARREIEWALVHPEYDITQFEAEEGTV